MGQRHVFVARGSVKRLLGSQIEAGDDSASRESDRNNITVAKFASLTGATGAHHSRPATQLLIQRCGWAVAVGKVSSLRICMAPPGQPVQNITFVAMRPDKPVVKPKKEPLSREAEEDQTVKKTSVSSDPITCIKLLFSGGAITGPVGVGTIHSQKDSPYFRGQKCVDIFVRLGVSGGLFVCSDRYTGISI